jgi:catechol 2,3-dioxygenase-like lactoylglutathione lyase family enzyme
MPQLNAVGMIVGDLARAVRFYRTLGVPFDEGAENSEHGHAEAGLGAGFRLLLDTEAGIRSFDPDWKPASGGQPRTAVVFGCTDPAEVDRLYSAALASGGQAHKEPWDAFWGQRYAQLRDPDGNAVDLYADQPA